MPTITRSAEAEWKGSVKEGTGHMDLQSGAYQGPYSFQSRFEEGKGTNPEELIAAAHAGCFSMAFSAQLTTAGHAPTRIHTRARVTIEKLDAGWTFRKVHLECVASVAGIDDAKLRELADKAKAGCPVSRLLAPAVEIQLELKRA